MVPPGLSSKISSVDVDGRIQGHWTLDTESYAGKGKIVFRGDSQGDIFLRDSSGRRIEARLNPQAPDRLYEIPLLADSTWTIDRVDGIDFDRQRINGHFLLTTLIDYMVFQIFGVNWNEHDEVTFEYDHMPYTAKGFDTKIGEFFQQVAEEQKKDAQKAKEKKP